MKEIKNKGFKINKPFPGNEGLGKLRQIIYKNQIILQVREEDNGIYTTLESLKYPSSFPKVMHNVKTEKVLEMLDSIMKINFKEEITC